MGIKKSVLLLIVLSVLMSGCLNSGEDKEQEEDNSEGYSGSSGGSQRYEETQTPEETATSGEMETTVETEILEEIWTPEETETAKEILNQGDTGEIKEEQNENMNEEGEGNGTLQPSETEAETYLVRLRSYVFIPSELEANTGALVVWRNFEDNLFTLTSEEGLFEDQKLGYGNSFKYTFNKTGSYNFNVNGYPNMHMTITIK